MPSLTLNILIMIVSIGDLGGGRENYYTDLAQEDYYLTGGEPLGRWFGGGLAALGLAQGEVVTKQQLSRLVKGFSPDGSGVELVQNAGSQNRRAGWDLCINFGKDFTALTVTSPEQLRTRLKSIGRDVTEAVLDEFEKRFAWSARGPGGRIRERSKTVFAVFPHGTSRTGCPHEHIHCALINSSLRPDGSFGAVRAFNYDAVAKYLGAFGRVVLAKTLRQELGLKLEPNGEFFRISGVPRSLEIAFSRRRLAITEAMKRKGLEGAKAAAAFALKTRPSKQPIPRSVLYGQWKAVAAEHGFTPEVAQSLVALPQERENSAAAPAHPRSTSRSTPALSSRMAEWALRLKDVVKTALEENILRRIRRSARTVATTDRLPRNIKTSPKLPDLSPDQREVYRSIVTHKGNLAVLAGPRESGKTQVIVAVASALRHDGYELHVLSPTHLGKTELALRTDQSVMTMRSFFARAGKGFLGRVRHHARGLARAALRRQTFAPLHLSNKSAIILDSAHIASPEDLARLLELASGSGSRVVLAGRDQGSAFLSLHERLAPEDDEKPTGRLQRSAVWLDALDVEPAEPRSLNNPKHVLTLHPKPSRPTLFRRRFDAQEQNLSEQDRAAARSVRRSKTRHVLRRARVARHQPLFEGDRVLLRRDAPQFGVVGGDLGTVERVSAVPGLASFATLTIRLDRVERKGVILRPVRVRVPLSRYRHVSLAYAFTERQAEGTRLERDRRRSLEQPPSHRPDPAD